MIQYDETRLAMEALEPQLEELRGALNLDGIKIKLDELEMKTTEPNFWDDPEKSQAVMQQIGQYKQTIGGFEKLCANREDVLTMIELAEEENDESMAGEVNALAETVKKEFEEQKLSTLLTGEYDSSNAIVSFHAGAGGTEAQDWVQMLIRMYTKWADSHGFKTEVLDILEGDTAGIKSASIHIEGYNAYGFLKSEHGVHRLVRISPFDSSARRQTSFASVEVMPELEKDVSVEIRPEDIEMEVYRASGAGGQHINKTSSAVRLIHKPTGIVTACQTQRSQVQNKDFAMKMLMSKLVQIKEQEHLDKISDIKGEQLKIEWGSQIRSYVFMPYTLAKDARTKCENANINAVMDGDIDCFINAYLKAKNLGEI
ncbi:MAG: peptide chain release factor 2 [Lachnospiraceae bacterium]|nr:peptide chain release factor 2 [Ruminococcus sp.]MCM1274571.1 peptide chain release factor 2 [Lachnospiraceae bacterium]